MPGRPPGKELWVISGVEDSLQLITSLKPRTQSYNFKKINSARNLRSRLGSCWASRWKTALANLIKALQRSQFTYVYTPGFLKLTLETPRQLLLCSCITLPCLHRRADFNCVCTDHFPLCPVRTLAVFQIRSDPLELCAQHLQTQPTNHRLRK